MRKAILFVTIVINLILTSSCSSSKAVISHEVDLAKYEYVVFGNETSGDKALDDIIMLVENEITNTRLQVVSASQGLQLINQGKFVLSPNINVKTQYWDGGHTYITISFYDYNTNQRIAVLKSSGIGLSISQDQNIALNAIKKKLQKVF